MSPDVVDVILREGGTLRLRSPQRDDADGLLSFFQSLSQRSLYGAELLAGVVQDPVFGPLVAFGPGGVLAELIGEATFRIAPLTDVDAEELVLGGKAGRLVRGFRGAPAADLATLLDLVQRLARLGDELPAVAELDLSLDPPFRVHARRSTGVSGRARDAQGGPVARASGPGAERTGRVQAPPPQAAGPKPGREAAWRPGRDAAHARNGGSRLNPVIAFPDGCVAVDARVHVTQPEHRARAKTW